MKATALAAALSLAVIGPAFPQAMNHDGMSKMSHDQMPMKAPSATMTDGQVKDVDKAKGTITLNHGEIKEAKMPAMTMAYKASDSALLDKVAIGDKVGFALEQVNGAYLVTAIEKK